MTPTTAPTAGTRATQTVIVQPPWGDWHEFLNEQPRTQNMTPFPFGHNGPTLSIDVPQDLSQSCSYDQAIEVANFILGCDQERVTYHLRLHNLGTGGTRANGMYFIECEDRKNPAGETYQQNCGLLLNVIRTDSAQARLIVVGDLNSHMPA